MSFAMTCGCGQPIIIAPQNAGQWIRCPRCQKTFAAPQMAQPVMAQPTMAAPMGAYSAAPPLNAAWYLRTTDGQSFGPVPKTEIDGWVGEGLINGDAMVMNQSDGLWRMAKEMYPVLNHGNMAQATNNVVVYVNNPAPEGSHRSVSRKRPHRGSLILTLALLGWFVFGFLCIPAWLMGLEDLKQMRAGRMDRSGESMTYFGMIMGAIGTMLMGLVVVIVFFVVLAAIAGS